ncbi:hypothetical protein BJX61DRAFT_516223 [Aspergillus egyptiacus]|nr:hypothetical protein BJX61DRAFT_516223 [Aspergillus egyptiacus]
MLMLPVLVPYSTPTLPQHYHTFTPMVLVPQQLQTSPSRLGTASPLTSSARHSSCRRS